MGVLSIPLATLAVSAPVGRPVWAPVTSVYAHGSLAHLVANSLALLVVGLYLERQTSRLRFHAFFLVTGMLAGLTEVWVSGVLGQPVAVLGASGAIFALFGYVFAGNRLSETVLDALPLGPRAQLAIFAVVAATVTYLTAGRGVALIAHFTGLLLGLLAGRAHVLRT